MKKIAGNRKRAIKRAMSPACELISTVVPETSAVEDSTANDSLTAYAGFLLQQHRATHQDSSTFVPDIFTANFEKCAILR